MPETEKPSNHTFRLCQDLALQEKLSAAFADADLPDETGFPRLTVVVNHNDCRHTWTRHPYSAGTWIEVKREDRRPVVSPYL